MSDTLKWAALSREVAAKISKVDRRLARFCVPEKEMDRWADKCWRLYGGAADRQPEQRQIPS